MTNEEIIKKAKRLRAAAIINPKTDGEDGRFGYTRRWQAKESFYRWAKTLTKEQRDLACQAAGTGKDYCW